MSFFPRGYRRRGNCTAKRGSAVVVKVSLRNCVVVSIRNDRLTGLVGNDPNTVGKACLIRGGLRETLVGVNCLTRRCGRAVVIFVGFNWLLKRPVGVCYERTDTANRGRLAF